MLDVSAGTIVGTSLGKVRGAVVDGIHAFKGVPYAAPPFGANRLRAPQPAAAVGGCAGRDRRWAGGAADLACRQ